MTPRKENIPLTIDANYVVGFNYLRQWQIRGVVDVAPGIALGVSAENPAAIFVGSTAPPPHRSEPEAHSPAAASSMAK